MRGNPVKNRHVTAHVDENTGALAFLYEVADGPCTESFGIKVAELAGFPPATVQVAKRKAEELESNSGGKLKALRAWRSRIAPSRAVVSSPYLAGFRSFFAPV